MKHLRKHGWLHLVIALVIFSALGKHFILRNWSPPAHNESHSIMYRAAQHFE